MNDVEAALGRLRASVFCDDPTISFNDESNPFEDVRTALREIDRLRAEVLHWKDCARHTRYIPANDRAKSFCSRCGGDDPHCYICGDAKK